MSPPAEVKQCNPTYMKLRYPVYGPSHTSGQYVLLIGCADSLRQLSDRDQQVATRVIGSFLDDELLFWYLAADRPRREEVVRAMQTQSLRGVDDFLLYHFLFPSAGELKDGSSESKAVTAIRGAPARTNAESQRLCTPTYVEVSENEPAGPEHSLRNRPGISLAAIGCLTQISHLSPTDRLDIQRYLRDEKDRVKRATLSVNRSERRRIAHELNLKLGRYVFGDIFIY